MLLVNKLFIGAGNNIPEAIQFSDTTLRGYSKNYTGNFTSILSYDLTFPFTYGLATNIGGFVINRGIQLSLFCDIGDTWSDFNSSDFIFKDLKTTCGLELGLFNTLLFDMPFTFSMGYGINIWNMNKEKSDPQFYFSFNKAISILSSIYAY